MFFDRLDQLREAVLIPEKDLPELKPDVAKLAMVANRGEQGSTRFRISTIAKGNNWKSKYERR